MTVRVNRGLFLSSLESVKAGLSPREILEQSSCIVFGDGRAMTYNDEVACSSSTGLDSSFKGAVQANPLLTILGKLTEEEVDLEIIGSELVITGTRRSAGIRMDKEVLLPVTSVELPKEWLPMPSEFSEAVEVVSQCAGKDASQFQLTCVHIHPKWLEACDNFQLCRWKLKTGVKESVLVRCTAIRNITGLGMTEFGETDSWMHFRNPSGLVLSCRRFLEEFPDLTEVLKVEGTQATLPKGLAEEADKANVFSSENSEHKLVLIQLRPGKLRIRGQGVSGWYEARSKAVYTGEPMQFMISPQLLIDLVKRHSECVVSPERLLVNANGYVWITCLSKPPEDEDIKPAAPKKKGSKGVEDAKKAKKE